MIKIKRIAATLGCLILFSPEVSSAQDSLSALPRFLPMKDAQCQFLDESRASEMLLDDITNVFDSDEGLYTAARVRDFILGFPYSARFQSPDHVAWTLPFAIAYIDQYGLFELSPIAAERALNLSKLPLVDLDVTGVLGLCYTARYYGETGRADLADKIYSNLTANVWPKLASQALSGTVLFAYADFLKARNDTVRSEAFSLAGQRMRSAVNGSSRSIFLPEEISPVHSSLGWKPTYLAYQAIVAKDFPKANTLIDALLSKERAKAKHSQADFDCFIQLAKCYTKHGHSAEAVALLKHILPFADSDVSANLRLYALAELFNCDNKSFEELVKCADKIDEIVRRISLAPRGSEAEYGSRTLDTFDRLSLAYAYNGESQKAYKILEASLKKFSPSPERKALIDSHRAYFAALVGRYPEVSPDIETDINAKESCRGSVEYVLAKIMDVCMKAGKLDVAEAFARHFISARTKVLESRPIEAGPGMSPGTTNEQLMQNRKFELEMELSAVHYKLGEILNATKRYEEAEKVLKSVQNSFCEIVRMQHVRWTNDLCCALEGQKKYDEALAQYKSESQSNGQSSVPMWSSLIRFIEQKPVLTAAQQEKFYWVSLSVASSTGSKYMLIPFAKLLALVKEQHWPEADVQKFERALDDYYTFEGRLAPRLKEQ